MKFDRKYEPAILVYRETRPPGRLLMRLGRLHDDGTHSLEEEVVVGKSFTFATRIITKDTHGLLDRMRKLLDSFVEDAAGDADAFSVDYPALKATLNQDDGTLASDLERLWGAPAMKCILALPILTTRQQRRALNQEIEGGGRVKINTTNSSVWRPFLMGGLLLTLAIPIGLIALFHYEQFETPEPKTHNLSPDQSEAAVAGDTSVVQSGTQTESDTQIGPMELAREAERDSLLARFRTNKQSLYLAADFGTLDAQFSASRPIPTSSSQTDSPARQDHENLGTVIDPVLASRSHASSTQGRSIPLPDDDTTRMAATFGIPIDIAQHRLSRLEYDDNSGMSVRAHYDIRRGVDVIFEAKDSDMRDLPPALDAAAFEICDRLTPPDGAQAEIPDNSTITIILRAASSNIAGLILDRSTCTNGSYNVFTLFEPVDLSTPNPEAD